MKSKVLIKRAIIIVILIAISVVGICAFWHVQKQNRMKKDFMARIATETYDSVFFSMYSIENYSVEDFEEYRNVTPILSTYKINSLSEMSECLKAAFESPNIIENVYLGLDTEVMWKDAGENTDKWIQSLSQDLGTLFVEYPGVSFDILLSYPELDYWTKMNQEQLSTNTANITTFTIALSPFSNVNVYFPGMEEWLIANPANYNDQFITTPDISQKLIRFVFCDQRHRIDAEDIYEKLEVFEEYVTSQKENPTKYQDLSDWNIVFFGDSIIGNYKGSLSIPGVVNGLSKARVYNYGVGGTPAGHLLERVADFANQSIGETRDKGVFPYDEVNTSGENLCFVIHYGLNDYFGGASVDNPSDAYDTNTYAGCLRSGIKQLQQNYPNAKIILMPPPFTITFTNGTEIKSPVGGVLVDYVDAAISVAEEMQVDCLESYYALGMNEDNEHIYLADGCHYNEYGRYLTGIRTIRMLESEENN